MIMSLRRDGFFVESQDQKIVPVTITVWKGALCHLDSEDQSGKDAAVVSLIVPARHS